MENSRGISPVLIINNLTLVGIRKNYSVPFLPGLNIIHGDSDTGKSSILNLIDYCLGSSSVDYYDEINSAARCCLLELALNGKIYTIKRDIFDTNAMIEVYQSTIKDMDTVFPLRFAPNFKKEGEDGFISDFFLDALSIPKITIKDAPTKADSEMKRLSFRDILKYSYLNQDDTGSKNILNNDNFTRAVRHQETFKFLHNLLDEAISQLQSYIGDRTTLRSQLNNRYTTISAFLRETQLKHEVELESQRADLREKVALINSEIDAINRNMTADTSAYSQLRVTVNEIVKIITQKRRERDNLQIQMQQNILLKNDYHQDIHKLETSKAMQEKLPQLSQHVDCPLCSNPLKIEDIRTVFQESGADYIDKEIKTLEGRYRDISSLIDENRNAILVLQEETTALSDNLDEARNLLDNRTKETITPYLSQRDGLLTTKTKMLETIEHIEHTLKIRNQLRQISSNVAKLDRELEGLNIKLKELQAKTPTVDEVTNDIGNYLSNFLHFVRMNNVTGIGINKRTFLPIVRDIDYPKLTSGGVRTLVSVGYFVSLLRNSMQKGTNHPNFLMIDTIGKYLGKTKAGYMNQTNQNEDISEGITASDPTKYIRMYEYILDLCGQREDVQIIVVDNDIPAIVASNFASRIVREFDPEGRNGLQRGFIDDAHIYKTKRNDDGTGK